MRDKNHTAKITEDGLGPDWGWVRKRLIKSEKIPAPEDAGCGSRIIKHADSCLQEAALLIQPKISSIKKKVLKLGHESIEVEGPVVLSSKTLSAHLKGASYLHFYAVTIGKGAEDTASAWMSEGRELDGYLMDRIGSLAVESLARITEETLRGAYASKNLSVSMRFSPGYCDWPIEEQLKIAGIVDFSKAGISLTKSCVMVPKKSISAVVGVGPKGLFAKPGSPCAMCVKKDCSYRR